MFFLHCTVEFQFSEQVWHSSPHTSLWLACPQHWECSWKDPHIFVYKKWKVIFDEIKFIPWIIPAVALKTVNFVSSWKFTHKYKCSNHFFHVVHCMIKSLCTCKNSKFWIMLLCIKEIILHHKISSSTPLEYENYEISLVHNLNLF